MKPWRLVLRIASDSGALQDIGVLKRNIANFMRVVETYEVNCLGIRMIGVDFLAEDEDFNHTMQLIKILKDRYRLSIMQFSELCEESDPGMTVRVGSKPATRIA